MFKNWHWKGQVSSTEHCQRQLRSTWFVLKSATISAHGLQMYIIKHVTVTLLCQICYIVEVDHSSTRHCLRLFMSYLPSLLGTLVGSSGDQGFFSTHTPHFRGIRQRNYAFLQPTMRNATYFYPGSMRSVMYYKCNVDSVYCTIFLCINDRICSLLHTCSVCFVIIKNCFVVTASYPYFCWHKG